MTEPAHAPIPGAYTISGAPRCVCGYHHRSRWGSEAREALKRHIAEHAAAIIRKAIPDDPRDT